MIAAAGVLALAFALAQEARAQDDRPLRNDCVLGLAKAPGEEFARGDALEALSAPQFDAWQRALLLGAEDRAALVPLPEEQGGEKRGGESAELALLRRVGARGAAGWDAWRARFEELARGEFARLAPDEQTLERFVSAHAGTQSAQRAALRLSDLARERGDAQAACAALVRVRAQGPLAPEFEAALEKRVPSQIPARARAGAAPVLEPLFTRTLDVFDAREEWIPARRAGAALGELADGRLLWWSADALRTLDAAGALEPIELAALSSERSWSHLPAFRDEPSPWTQTLLVRGELALLTLGRARERRQPLRGARFLRWRAGARLGLGCGRARARLRRGGARAARGSVGVPTRRAGERGPHLSAGTLLRGRARRQAQRGRIARADLVPVPGDRERRALVVALARPGLRSGDARPRAQARATRLLRPGRSAGARGRLAGGLDRPLLALAARPRAGPRARLLARRPGRRGHGRARLARAAADRGGRCAL
ncbi:MAG: hypothetical protein IPJ19_20440 [Planctomycetes bacterium]|nr:hypothetical protein [Planctomycetota bacterium]